MFLHGFRRFTRPGFLAVLALVASQFASADTEPCAPKNYTQLSDKSLKAIAEQEDASRSANKTAGTDAEILPSVEILPQTSSVYSHLSAVVKVVVSNKKDRAETFLSTGFFLQEDFPRLHVSKHGVQQLIDKPHFEVRIVFDEKEPVSENHYAILVQEKEMKLFVKENVDHAIIEFTTCDRGAKKLQRGCEALTRERIKPFTRAKKLPVIGETLFAAGYPGNSNVGLLNNSGTDSKVTNLVATSGPAAYLFAGNYNEPREFNWIKFCETKKGVNTPVFPDNYLNIPKNLQALGTNVINANVPIAGGMSGGPLLNSSFEVVGMNKDFVRDYKLRGNNHFVKLVK